MSLNLNFSLSRDQVCSVFPSLIHNSKFVAYDTKFGWGKKTSLPLLLQDDQELRRSSPSRLRHTTEYRHQHRECKEEKNSNIQV